MLGATASALVEVPKLRARVNDLAGLLSEPQRRQLDDELTAFEAETSHQVVVLTVPTLDGEDVAAFAIRVADAWKVGHEGLDNGVLLVVAERDRKARIEVGYGLEGVVPDAVAARILRERMIPSFRDGRMAEGIRLGALAVMRAARGEEVPFEDRPQRAGRRQDPVGIVFFCGIFGGVLGAALSGRSRPRGAVVGALVAFGLSYLLLHLFPLAAFSSVVGAMFGAINGGAGGRRSIHTFPGGWGGGGLGGGGFGGGGFGGGGGGFGGGGASGSW